VLPNYFEHSINVFKKFIVPESKNNKSVSLQACISLLVILRILCMLPTIKLNDDPLVK